VKLNGKIGEGFTEVREKLGSMVKSSYAEARIKALGEMAFS